MTDIAREVIAQAEKEYKEEVFREAVERYKQKLRERKFWWDRVFPWKIIVVKKEQYNVRRKQG